LEKKKKAKKSHLYLHPTADVVAGEVGADHVQHVHRERAERDRLLVLVVPRAPQLARLVPNLLHLRVVLDDDDVLEVRAGPGVGAVPVQAVLRVAGRAARVYADLEVDGSAAEPGGQMDAVAVAVVALAEHDPVERLVEAQEHLHRVLLALDVQRHDFGLVGGRGAGPRVAQRVAHRAGRVRLVHGLGQLLLLLLLLLRRRRRTVIVAGTVMVQLAGLLLLRRRGLLLRWRRRPALLRRMTAPDHLRLLLRFQVVVLGDGPGRVLVFVARLHGQLVGVVRFRVFALLCRRRRRRRLLLLLLLLRFGLHQVVNRLRRAGHGFDHVHFFRHLQRINDTG